MVVALLLIGLILVFLGSKVLGDGTSNLIGRMRCSIEVNLDWTAKVSSFLMEFLENNHVA